MGAATFSPASESPCPTATIAALSARPSGVSSRFMTSRASAGTTTTTSSTTSSEKPATSSRPCPSPSGPAGPTPLASPTSSAVSSAARRPTSPSRPSKPSSTSPTRPSSSRTTRPRVAPCWRPAKPKPRSSTRASSSFTTRWPACSGKPLRYASLSRRSGVTLTVCVQQLDTDVVHEGSLAETRDHRVHQIRETLRTMKEQDQKQERLANERRDTARRHVQEAHRARDEAVRKRNESESARTVRDIFLPVRLLPLLERGARR